MTAPRRTLRRAEPSRVTIVLDGETYEAMEGETLLSLMLVERGHVLRHTERQGRRRGMFCGMGVCMDCLVEIEGVGLVNACQTLVREGMVCRIQRNEGAE